LGKMLDDIRNSRVTEYQFDSLMQELQAVQKAAQPAPKLGQILVSKNIVDSATVEKSLAEANQTGRKLGEVLVEKGAVTAAQIGEALADQKRITDSASATRSMRVDVGKLDELINLIG